MPIEMDSSDVWKLLWEHHPNGLIILDAALIIQWANPAFCRIFKTAFEDLIGQPAKRFLGDPAPFAQVLATQQNITHQTKDYQQLGIAVRRTIFAIPERSLVACIMADITEEWQRLQSIRQSKADTIAQVNAVVNNQMKVVQEIAGLLGETTAETKISLLQIVRAIEEEVQVVEHQRLGPSDPSSHD
jgi:PAS domain-containing protein